MLPRRHLALSIRNAKPVGGLSRQALPGAEFGRVLVVVGGRPQTSVTNGALLFAQRPGPPFTKVISPPMCRHGQLLRSAVAIKRRPPRWR